jgi:hypothetical protein
MGEAEPGEPSTDQQHPVSFRYFAMPPARFRDFLSSVTPETGVRLHFHIRNRRVREHWRLKRNYSPQYRGREKGKSKFPFETENYSCPFFQLEFRDRKRRRA